MKEDHYGALTGPMPRWDSESWLRLALAGPVSLQTLARLADCCAEPAGLATCPADQLIRAGLSESAARVFLEPGPGLDTARTWLEHAENTLLTLASPDYPPLLRRIADPPIVLFARGRPEILRLPQLAMVGSRNPTPAGETTARRFARHFASRGLAITSGLATGIDAASHIGALEADGFTVAVCATGLDQVYPSVNQQLAERIAQQGVLVSEFPLGAPPRRHHFPLRNRIISGISVGTLVVEAARRSGSLITARAALEQGREVLAIPGSIHNPLARGCHSLIRAGAKLVETADDVVEEIAPLVGAQLEGADVAPDNAATPTETLDSDYTKLLDAMGFDPVDQDTLTQRSGLTTAEVSSMLLILELKGVVVAAPGGLFYRTDSTGNS